MVLILAVPALLFVALVIIGVAGDGVMKRTETSTAADAAALGAAEEWRTYVNQVFIRANGASLGDALAWLKPILTTDAAQLDQSAVGARARQLAADNGSEVTSLNIRRTARGLEFTVSTRNLDAVTRTTTKARAEATAVVELTAGACWKGARLGVRRAGDCLAWLDLSDALTPTPPPDDEPTPSPSPSPTPTAALAVFRADTRLVA